MYHAQGGALRVGISSKLPGEAQAGGSQRSPSQAPGSPESISGYKEWELSRALTHEGASLEEMGGVLRTHPQQVEQGKGSC